MTPQVLERYTHPTGSHTLFGGHFAIIGPASRARPTPDPALVTRGLGPSSLAREGKPLGAPVSSAGATTSRDLGFEVRPLDGVIHTSGTPTAWMWDAPQLLAGSMATQR